jgi:proline iminopeptidase
MDDVEVRQAFVRVDGARLFVAELGDGAPLVVLHGGPDFDHAYLRPELDRLAGATRLVYYDQRGRGRSSAGVRPTDVTMESELRDLDALRAHLGLESTAVLGHSWGAVVAMAYAARHPERVSHLVLLNPAPASRADWVVLAESLERNRPAADVARLAEVAETPAFREGDAHAEADYYRAHFRMTLRRPDLLEELVGRLRRHFTADGVLAARAVEERLYDETCRTDDFDLLPGLRGLGGVPTLVLTGEHDFIPVETAVRIADAVPGARLAVLPDCGHFTFLERPDDVRAEVGALLGPAAR